MGNTLVAENIAMPGEPGADVWGPFHSLGHNLIGIVDGGAGFGGTDLFGTAAAPLDAMLDYRNNHEGVPESPRHVLIPRSGSPVIDAGDDALLFHPDFAGSACFDARLTCCPRVRGAAVDIGAIEVQTGDIIDICAGLHAADLDGDFRFSLSEVLRVTQLFTSGGHHCDASSEDGFAPGPGDQSCTPHGSDYLPQDWRIGLSELLRAVQFYNVGAYHACPDAGTEDGLCAGAQ